MEAVSKNSLELKTLEQRSICLIDEILLEVGRNITVCILLHLTLCFPTINWIVEKRLSKRWFPIGLWLCSVNHAICKEKWCDSWMGKKMPDAC